MTPGMKMSLIPSTLQCVDVSKLHRFQRQKRHKQAKTVAELVSKGDELCPVAPQDDFC